MRFDDSKRIGDEGERRVSEALRRLQAQWGFVYLDDVWIAHGKNDSITAQVDHVIVDRQGVVAVETKVRTGALLRGTYADQKWTACYPGRERYTFQNPLRQSEHHENLLRQALAKAGVAMEVERVRGLVVFVDTRTSELELDSPSKSRVVDLENLDAWFAERNDFMHQTPLSEAERQNVVSALMRLDRSSDDTVIAQHGAYRTAAAPQARWARKDETSRAGAPGRPTPASPIAQDSRVAPVSHSSIPRTSPRVLHEPVVSANAFRLVALVTLSLTALGFIVWLVRGIMTGTAPWWVWVVVLGLLAALGGEQEAGKRRRRSQPYRTHAPRESLNQYLIRVSLGLALMLGTVVFLASGGFDWFAHAIVQGMTQSQQPQSVGTPMQPSPSAEPSYASPQTALQEVDPITYAKVANLNSPAVSNKGGFTAYTWDYIEQSSGSSASVHTVTLILDSTGMVRGYELAP